MESPSVERLNQKYAIAGHVAFRPGPGGLVTAFVDNACCTAAITLAGGQVISYQPDGQDEVLWMSPNSPFAPGEAIRGGIPVCWPWFGPHDADPDGMPKHGFARNSMWSVKGTQALRDGATEVRLAFEDTAQTREMWPYSFEVELVVTCGNTLQVEMIVHNRDQQPFQYAAALHHYFAVSDVRQVRVLGLEDTDYLDKVDHMKRKRQSGPVTITETTDRIYLDTQAECVIEDPGYGRAIHVSKTGSRTTVVWNPQQRAGLIPDVGAGNEVGFICVETANAANDIVTVDPGGESHLNARIWLA